MKKTLITLLCLLAALMISCCGLCESTQASPDDVLATVNGVPVTRGDVDGRVPVYVAYYTENGYDVSGETEMHIIRSFCLDACIQNELLIQHAPELDAVPSDEEIAQAAAQMEQMWDETALSVAQEQFGLTADAGEEDRAAAIAQAEAFLTENTGYTRETLAAEAVENLRYSKVVKAVCTDLSVSDEDVAATYAELVAQEMDAIQGSVMMYEYYSYYGYELHFVPEGYRGVIQILLAVDEGLLNTYQQLAASTDESVTPEMVEEARLAVVASVQPAIDDINARFAAGTPFTDLIAEYNIDPGMTDADTLANGYQVHQESFVWDPAFVQAAFSVDEVGQMSAPFVGDYGIYIVYYLRDIPAGAVDMTDDVRAEIVEMILEDRQDDTLNALLNVWTETADIVYSEEALASYVYIPEE
ncbi:MAG: hypothetical protein CW338_00540 [Clostridiales bacterium]|nr:hypothetical protein [Clostridiales bacterium]